MSHTLLFIKLLLLVHQTTQSKLEIQADCNRDVSLKCLGVSNPADFLTVAWYKFKNDTKAGIIRGNGITTPQRYNFSRETSFGDKLSLVLLRVTPEDSGRYECVIYAKVGGKNQYYEVQLTVHECAGQPEITTVVDTLTNTTLTNQFCHKQGQDLPVMWTIIGYVAVALAKIIFSLIILRIFHIRSSRRWRRRLCS